jgi:hypothetical protein
MKSISNFCRFFILLNFISLCRAQQVTQQSTTLLPPTQPSVVSRDANSRVWRWTEYEQGPGGQSISQAHSYTELATGLCYRQNGQWMDSLEQINILPDGSAAATNGQHQAYFPADIFNGFITLVTPNGLKLQSQPIALSYNDGTNTVIIGVLTNSIGELISSNQIIYPNAFEGIDADLLYTYKKSGFEQDVIFRQKPPAPDQFGLNSENSGLQLLTEFFDPPTPVQNSVPGNSGLQDTTLTFGQMTMGHGRAFSADTTSSQNSFHQASVYKSWVNLNGRTMLVEEAPYQQLSSELATLPSQPLSAINSGNPILRKISSVRWLPPVRATATTTNKVQLARAYPIRKPGVVFDYIAINSDQTDFTFQADTTYYLTGYYLLSGTTVLEGGAVIKCNGYSGSDDGSIEISSDGTLDCQTAPYRPAIFTSQNDNTIGETIGGISSGSPNYTDVQYFLVLDPTNMSLHDLRFSYAYQGIINFEPYATSYDVRDCQFLNIEIPCYGWNVNLYNVLIGYTPDETSGIISDGNAEVGLLGSIVAENVTADSGYTFIQEFDSGQTAVMTNCLITSQTIISNSIYSVTFFTNHVVYLPSPSVPVYQVVGGGNYYLTNNSPYHTNGTSDIDPVLLNDLTKKTTWPPIVYAGTNISSLATLGPTARRDTNGSPDLGYHYDPLDYAFGGCNLYSNLTFTAGTVVAWGDIVGFGYGISLDNGANLSLNGDATQPDIVTYYQMAQEGGNGNWPFTGILLGFSSNGNNLSEKPLMSADFTKWAACSLISEIQDSPGYGADTFRNCEFYDGSIVTHDMQSLYFTNCLFFRVQSDYWDQDYDLSFNYENCTFYNGGIQMVRSGLNLSSWQAENNSFDGTAIWWNDVYNGSSYTLFNYNAYNTNNLSWQTYPENGGNPFTNMLENVGLKDLMITNFNWETSWFGNFYLPTNSLLIQAGSTTADQVGLYWFTTQTNQAPESNNIVDIGYHYVATDTNGNPLATFGTNVPNYILYPDGAPPTIIIEPTNQTVLQGANVAFSVTAEGFPALSYQWYFGSSSLANQTNATLTFDPAQISDAGNYYVVVTNVFGAITSSIVTLDVSLNVTNFGAWPDAQQVHVYTTAGSSKIGFTNTLSAGDIGKTITIELVGDFTTPTNNQDLVGVITNFSGTNALIGIATNYVNGAFVYGNDTPQVTVPFPNPSLSGAHYDANGHFVFGPVHPIWNYTWTPGTTNDLQIDDPFTNSMPTNNNGGFYTFFTNIILVGTPDANITASVTSEHLAFCTYGTNNYFPFKNCMAAAGTNTAIIIPAGTVSPWGSTNAYLFAPLLSYTNAGPNFPNDFPNEFALSIYCIIITNGGLDFEGAGQGQSILMACGAWKSQNFICCRSSMFGVNSGSPGIAAPYPLTINNLTIDGGVEIGLKGQEDQQPANQFTGNGWDGTDEGINDDIAGNSPFIPIITNINCTFQNLRGEAVIGTPDQANPPCFAVVSNCDFYNDNADCFNYEHGIRAMNCLASNVYEFIEYYQGHGWTNFSSFYSGCTFIDGPHPYKGAHTLAALVNANAENHNANYIISNCVFHATDDSGDNGIGLSGFDNLTVVGCTFFEDGLYATPIVLNAAGYQTLIGTFTNTAGIRIYNNIFTNNSFLAYVRGGSSSVSSDAQDILTDCIVSNNTIYNAGYVGFVGMGIGTNIIVTANQCFGAKMGVSSGYNGCPYALVNTNNSYWQWILQNNGGFNSISYGGGSRVEEIYPYSSTTNILRVDDASQIPAGAAIIITNATTANPGSGGYPVTNWPAGTNWTVTPIVTQPGQSVVLTFNFGTVKWTNTSYP